MDNQISQLRNYYDHLVKIQVEAHDLISGHFDSPESIIFNRVIERYFQIIVDDIRGIDYEYGKFMGIYSPGYSILKDDNKLAFLNQFIGSEFTKNIYELGKVRNNIVHSPWLIESEQLKFRIDQLLVYSQALAAFLLRNWICKHCKALVVLENNEKLDPGTKITCPKCEGENVVISFSPLILEPIWSNSELAAQCLKEARRYYDLSKESNFTNIYFRMGVEKYLKAKELGSPIALRELGLICFEGKGIPKDDDLALDEWLAGAELGDSVCCGLLAAHFGDANSETEEFWNKYFNGETAGDYEIDLATKYIIYAAENNKEILYAKKLLPLRKSIHNNILALGWKDASHQAALKLLKSLHC